MASIHKGTLRGGSSSQHVFRNSFFRYCCKKFQRLAPTTKLVPSICTCFSTPSLSHVYDNAMYEGLSSRSHKTRFALSGSYSGAEMTSKSRTLFLVESRGLYCSLGSDVVEVSVSISGSDDVLVHIGALWYRLSLCSPKDDAKVFLSELRFSASDESMVMVEARSLVRRERRGQTCVDPNHPWSFAVVVPYPV